MTNEEWLNDYNRPKEIEAMSLTMKNEGGNFTPCPAGNHIAVCYAVIDLGTQHSEAHSYNGNAYPASDKPQVLVMWEVPGETIEIDGEQKPATVSKFYNAFFSERAALRQHLEAWRGQQFSEAELMGFDITNLLGKPCMVNVVHNDNGKAKVAGIAAMPKGVPVAKPTNDLIHFDFDNYDQEVFDNISEGIQKIIMKSPEWEAHNQPTQGFREAPDGEPPAFQDSDLQDVPF